MKIGIIIHSQTGHTLSVAHKLREQFLNAGHTVSIERVAASNDTETNVDSIALTCVPKLDKFDMLVLGAAWLYVISGHAGVSPPTPISQR